MPSETAAPLRITMRLTSRPTLRIPSWAVTLFLGFSIAHCLIFHVRTGTMRMVLFMLCAIPFWTSGIIRTIVWIIFLGRNGVLNTMLIDLQVVDRPLDFLLFSDFAVIVTYVHL